MPVTSTRAQWDEGLRTVRQFNDLLRVLPPIPQAGQPGSAGRASQGPLARRSGSPSRPIKPGPPRPELASGRSDTPPSGADVGSYTQQQQRGDLRPDPARSPPPSRNGHQSPHYQR
jgi:hypothetical protein